MRAGGASSPWAPVVEAVEGIDGLMNDAGHAQGEGTLKLSFGELHGLLDRMRTAGLDGAG